MHQPHRENGGGTLGIKCRPLAVQPPLLEPFKRGLGPNKYLLYKMYMRLIVKGTIPTLPCSLWLQGFVSSKVGRVYHSLFRIYSQYKVLILHSHISNSLKHWASELSMEVAAKLELVRWQEVWTINHHYFNIIILSGKNGSDRNVIVTS